MGRRDEESGKLLILITVYSDPTCYKVVEHASGQS